VCILPARRDGGKDSGRRLARLLAAVRLVPVKISDLHRRWSKDADDALGEEFDLARALIEARTAAGLSQSQLAKKMKTRFLSAVDVPSDCQLLMAQDCESGEPEFRELEPDLGLAAPARGTSQSRLTLAACQYRRISQGGAE
jgi:hypothetical protein